MISAVKGNPGTSYISGALSTVGNQALMSTLRIMDIVALQLTSDHILELDLWRMED